MIFQVLGPLQVDGQLASGSPARRALLTALLLRRGHVLGVCELTQLLWDDPPPSATANIRSHLTGLRRDLDRALPGLSSRLVTHRGVQCSYSIQVDAAELDLSLFVTLARQGRLELVAGDVLSAVDTLEQAIALWRGTFRHDLPPTHWFDAHVAGLDDARIDAYQNLFTAYLLAGRTQLLSYRIESLLTEAPYRQVLWELLAAVRCIDGNAAGALDAIRRCQALYAGDLGLDLPPGLESLRVAALTWDTDLAVRIVASHAASALDDRGTSRPLAPAAAFATPPRIAAVG